MQAQAPVHVANVQVGRSNRQVPSELDLPFLFNKELFTDTDGERALVTTFNHRFPLPKIVYFTFSGFSLYDIFA